MSERKTNPILEAAKQHLSDADLVEIEVPEWGPDGEEGAPLLLYSSPLTLAERRKADRMNKNDDAGRLVDIVIMKAKKGDGEKAFTRLEKQDLLRSVDSEVLVRICKEIARSDADDDDLEEPEKN